ncbi:GumC family protein [Sphingosinicella sp. LY1275]|uniref:GumC family protein n=1 Tax=Sphingosinicella sp. LY1275 TaxID=3095379 RepID=UPI002ADEE283|nr:polysaccharide biosynthesis tyrosine autokinase [Sphingosinicella sp. LY1275]MEA1014471.1 polysaccharide biosynthesis tyrosine autokinase [Sphingosinicella sp. LY1275]
MNDLAFRRVPFTGTPDVALPPGGTAEQQRHASLPLVTRYLRILKRWRWLILGATAVAAILGLIITLLMTPQYTAEATLEIQRESYRIVQVEGVEPEGKSVDMEFYQTQYGLLKARSLAERVARDLRLHESASFFEMFGEDKVADAINGSKTAVVPPGVRDERIRRAGEILLDNVAITSNRMSRLVDVEFTSPDAAFSAQVVNAWTRHFIETNLARRFEATSYARNFLESRLRELRQRLEESERMQVAYAARKGIINLPSTTSAPGTAGGSVTERPLVADNLSAINQELNEAIAERTKAQSRLAGAGGRTTEALTNQAITELRTRRAELAAERAKMLTQFEPGYPPAQALANQIRELDQAIAREEGRVSSTLQATYAAAAAREASLKARVDSLRGDLLDLRGRTIQYNIYQREVDTNRQLYDALLQRYKEIGIAGGVGVNNISVVDVAEVPELPSSPNLVLNVLLALLIGAAVGGGSAIALEQIDEAISDPSDVERALGLPLLGAIPKMSTDDWLAELEDRKSPVVEAYLSAQTSLSFTTDHGVPRSLTVSSTRPAEGKSTTSYALARSLARTGRRVILVDADMRSPSLHHFFDVHNAKGLSNYLAGDDDLAGLTNTDFPHGVALMTAGPPPPNAAELLTGDRISLLIEQLLTTFDNVIFDVPPVMGLADAPLIATKVEGAVFVIESHATRTSMARVAIGRLQDAQARVVGVLLTKFESKRAHYGYGYDYGYGYGENDKKAV